MLAVWPMHSHSFGMERPYATGGTSVALSFNYRAISNFNSSTVTNGTVAILDSSGAVVYQQTLVAGGTYDTGWRSFATPPIALTGNFKVRFYLWDAWTANWQEVLKIDQVTVSGQ